jgi:hypothetical protein
MGSCRSSASPEVHDAPPRMGQKHEHKQHPSDIAERTASRLIRHRHRPPSQTWRTFLTNHVMSLVSLDFFTVPTLTAPGHALRREPRSR